jgi:hypothetical protein
VEAQAGTNFITITITIATAQMIARRSTIFFQLLIELPPLIISAESKTASFDRGFKIP